VNDSRNAPCRREGGFTLVELTVTLLATVIVLLGVLALFDFTNRLSRVQGHVSGMQHSLRVAQLEVERFVRMAGRGGLPATSQTPPGGAIWVANNVAEGTTIGDAGTPEVAEGTDVLTVRGTFDTPIYQIETRDAAALTYFDNNGQVTLDPGQAVAGRVLIRSESPTRIPQSLEPLREAIESETPEALVLVNWRSPGIYAVVALDTDNSNVAGNVATVAFTITGNALAAQYARLSPGGVFPREMSSVTFVGILEEHRYYIREVDGFAPRLARARALPATNIAHGPAGGANEANWALDVADNVLDLQIALGLDTMNHVPRARPDGAPAEPPNLTTIAADPVNGYISEAAGGEDDDWLFNGAADDRADAVWVNTLPYYVRMTFLVRTERPDAGLYQAPLLVDLEDREYEPGHPFNSAVDRRYRRRALQTVINLRNL
jgi:type II secretory pathway pseudopilin PulG